MTKNNPTSNTGQDAGRNDKPERHNDRRTATWREKVELLVALILLAFWINFAWDFLKDVFS